MQIIKRCPSCGEEFTIEDLFELRDLHPTGLMADPRDANHCLLHFVHDTSACKTSFVIHTSEIASRLGRQFARGPAYRGTDCPGHCTQIEDLSVCKTSCSLRRYRELMLSLIERREAVV